jgi:hypothetical protein
MSLGEIIDWIGVVLILGAYISAVEGWVSATDGRYLLANIVGSAAIGYSSWKKRDIQPVILNIIWIIVAVLGIVRLRG